jgi:hypothetical protein
MQAAAIVALVLTFSPGCNRARRKSLSSSISTADPSAATQLTSGFYGVESNSWRWTAREFSVMLQPPAGSDRAGARLQVRLFIPDNQIAKLGSMTLSADIDGHDLPSQTFSKGGAYVYAPEVPPEALRSNVVPVNFSFDRAAPPAGGDVRELGAVVSAVGLVSR